MKTTTHRMQQAVLLVFAIALVSACASSRQAANSPVGTWDYVVKNTPYGNVEGQMIIEQDGDGYAGEIRSSQGNLTLNNVQINEGQLTSTFMMDGNSLSLEGAFEEDTFTGEVAAGSYDTFPMTAYRASTGGR
ncbi:hypothetical protein OKW21_005269 [Catalinimonas alkaloidigena]|uniref:hypothetical protein n=1 Tax=Catalinimonas alkaloidigena TaxID=1075417 RepID=UPI00240648F1|nr:hypothetical protein [Catalinimonas alkaloidigena]MDF9800006.1 hypothetical protein [Catalinimonas alkaloidigena]